ncbi:MAG: SAM-dependent methyltransferase [Pirellulaceae bacterium]|jgi:SAM-dependent methyltransferase
MFESQEACRSCGTVLGPTVLSLGSTPLANALLAADELAEPEVSYPLELAFCQHCSLLQLNATVSPRVLYDDYVYQSSYSDSLVQHAADICDRLAKDHALGAASQVIEIASNDGYLLQHYQARGVPVLGIEPARDIAAMANRRGIRTLNQFFDSALVDRVLSDGLTADVIHAHNVLAHVGDLPGFIRGVSRLLKPAGVWVIEVPYVVDLIDDTEFDTIYHEHLCYFSVTSLQNLIQSNGMRIRDVERLSIHGGSLRLFVMHQDAAVESDNVGRLLEQEERWGVQTLDTYRRFGKKVEDLKSQLRELLTELKGQGRAVAAYGASAKGTTLLSYVGIGQETLDFVVDRSDVKQGMYTPGTRLPILAPGELIQRRPDYVLLLTWNFLDEILQQQTEFRELGGKFIIPIPKVQVI